MLETGDRDAFAVHSDAPDAAYDLLVPDHAAFLLAEYAGEPLAAIVVALAGPTAVYLWGASSDRERNRMPNHAAMGGHAVGAYAAPPATISGASRRPGPAGHGYERRRGVPADDLPVQLGALPGHGLWGVYRFKQGFGGRVIRHAGAWDMPVDAVGARIYALGLEAQQLKSQRKANHEDSKHTKRHKAALGIILRQTLRASSCS